MTSSVLPSCPLGYRDARCGRFGPCGCELPAAIEFVRRPEPAEPVEFPVVEPGPVVLVRLPDTATIPPAVREALDDLARACHEAYGYAVEVIADDRDEVREALDLIRRHVDR